MSRDFVFLDAAVVLKASTAWLKGFEDDIKQEKEALITSRVNQSICESDSLLGRLFRVKQLTREEAKAKLIKESSETMFGGVWYYVSTRGSQAKKQIENVRDLAIVKLATGGGDVLVTADTIECLKYFIELKSATWFGLGDLPAWTKND